MAANLTVTLAVLFVHNKFSVMTEILTTLIRRIFTLDDTGTMTTLS